MSRYQKGKTNLDFTEARDSEWQWHQLGHMQVCTSLQTDNHASTPPLSFFAGRVPFLPPNQQRQSTEGTFSTNAVLHYYCVWRRSVRDGRRERSMGRQVYVRLLQQSDVQVGSLLLAALSPTLPAFVAMPLRVLRTARRASPDHVSQHPARRPALGQVRTRLPVRVGVKL